MIMEQTLKPGATHMLLRVEYKLHSYSALPLPLSILFHNHEVSSLP